MAEYNYGGTEEENAELRKLETELVRYHALNLIAWVCTDMSIYRPTTPTTSRHGRNSFAPQRRWRVESIATPTRKPLQLSEAHTTGFWPSSPCSSVTGRSMPIWSSLCREQRLRTWYAIVYPRLGGANIMRRSTKEASPVFPPPSTCGPTTAPSKGRPPTNPTSSESK